MGVENLRLTTSLNVAVITLSREEAGNRLDLHMAQELREVCRTVGQDKGIRTVVLTGSGKDFCAGLEAGGPAVEALEWANAAVEALAGIEQPLVAAVSGTAAGVGLAMALACDIRVASETAVLSADDPGNPGVLIGGISQRLPRIAGKGKALEMLLTGEAVGAGEARRLGLVGQVVPAGELGAVVGKLAEKIATRAPIAERYAKEAVLKGLDLTMEQGLRLECDLYMVLQATRDRVEGVKSFLSKKPPEFKGE